MVHDIAGVAKIQADLLRSAGHEVDEIELPDVGAAWSWPAKGIALPLRLAAYMPIAMRLRRGRYDVVHVHWLSHGIVGVLSARKFFAQAHGSDLHLNLNNPVYRWITRSVLKNARAIFYVTPNLKNYLKGYEDKLVHLPNPVDLRGIASGFAPPTQVAKVLIFTRLEPVKGVEHIFPAAEALSGMVEVTALSWGPLSAGYLKRYGRFVRFVPRVPHEEIGPFLQQFDLVIGQMRQGILSLSEIEALGAGRPVITGIDATLYEDDPPPVVAAHSADEVIQAVRELRADPDRLTSLALAGREWVRRNHSYAHHLELLQRIYFG
jgi:glycosyltransferase involved in cell wall biosynthesis